MRIFYDGAIYAMQATGGVNRYFSNLIGRLPTTVTPILAALRTQHAAYPYHPKLKTYEFHRFRPRRLSYRIEPYYFKLSAMLSQSDLAHPTYYSLLAQQDFRAYRCPVVLTVHDMIHELFFEQLDPTGHYAEEKRKAIMAAQAIICVSEHTKKDLLEHYPSLVSIVTVIPHASELNADLSYGPEPVPSQPYFLFVGKHAFYKNFDGLLDAFAKVVPKHPEVMLCAVGSAPESKECQKLADLRLSNNIKYYEQVSDAHLAKLYRCSIALVYPSLYEGFGIPLLEAMSCGTVVVASSRSSIPEVVANAGLLFDPGATDDLVDILLSLLTGTTSREQFIAKGRERARLYSWDLTVAKTLSLYRSVSRK